MMNLDGLSFPVRFRGTPPEFALEGGKLTVAAQADGFSQPITVGVNGTVKEIKVGERHDFELQNQTDFDPGLMMRNMGLLRFGGHSVATPPQSSPL
jgi:hypothetical protein